MRVSAVILWLAAGATQPNQQFDLVCTGAVKSGDEHAFKPADAHFTIDLAKQKWCLDALPGTSAQSCAAIHDIADIQPTKIWFEKESEAEQEQHLMHWSAVDRQTGEYTSIHQFDLPDGMGRQTVALEAHCEPAPFSGFPKIATKF
jgi:hypothetical protein